MSHKATVWAIQQRGLKPATKIVLWFLCDRHNPDFGCFPTQARLADVVSVQIAFIIPLLCYVFIAWYGAVGSKPRAVA